MNGRINRHSTVVAVSVPAVIGSILGALLALVLPKGHRGDVLTSTPAASRS